MHFVTEYTVLFMGIGFKGSKNILLKRFFTLRYESQTMSFSFPVHKDVLLCVSQSHNLYKKLKLMVVIIIKFEKVQSFLVITVSLDIFLYFPKSHQCEAEFDQSLFH